jgi:hypothetical protein
MTIFVLARSLTALLLRFVRRVNVLVLALVLTAACRERGSRGIHPPSHGVPDGAAEPNTSRKYLPKPNCPPQNKAWFCLLGEHCSPRGGCQECVCKNPWR